MNELRDRQNFRNEKTNVNATAIREMINEIESFGYSIGAREFNVKITSKNKAAIALFNKLNYKEKNKKSLGLIRMLKTI